MNPARPACDVTALPVSAPDAAASGSHAASPEFLARTASATAAVRASRVEPPASPAAPPAPPRRPMTAVSAMAIFVEIFDSLFTAAATISRAPAFGPMWSHRRALLPPRLPPAGR
eukprot:jgi/Ulvmu1/11623/UM008_0027.1